MEFSKSSSRRLKSAALLASLCVTAHSWAQAVTPPPSNTSKSTPAAKTPTSKEVATSPSDASSGADAEIVLSPFVVDSSKDTGYYSPNTLAGSRMKTNLADLGSSISVVTKRQMEDFGSTDVNDVFRYEVNTEGSSTYTPQTQTARSDGLLDINAGATIGGNVASLTNSTANRVRGIGVPSSAINYYPSLGSIAPDSYNTQSFEISRGPNSLLFGLGSPAGIVNQTTSQAQLNKNTNRAEIRADNWGSFRSSFSFNRSLIKDMLAINGAILWDDRQFERKPSYDNTRREYAALTFKPFSKTKITANFENYSNHNRRPNTISPTDYITQWNLAGRPTYDALTKKFTLLSTGQVIGPYISNLSSPYAQDVRNYITSLPGFNAALIGSGSTVSNFTTYNGQPIFGQLAINPTTSLTVPNLTSSVLYVPGVSEMNQTRAAMQIGNNGTLTSWFQPLYTQSYKTGYNNPLSGTDPTLPINNFSPSSAASTTTAPSTATLWANPTWSDIYNRDYFQSTGWTNNSFVTNVGGYKYPGVTDRSLFDWKTINVSEANFGMLKNKNYNLDFEQEITKDLFLSGGWFRQDAKQVTNYTIGQLNAAVIRIDENKYLPNGTANPYFGLPFVADIDPDQFVNTEVDDHFRAMIAYTPDFTQNKGWLKWLGHHQMLGLWSRDEYISAAFRKRLNYVAAGDQNSAYRFLANPSNLADGSRSGWNFTSATQRNFYLAHPGDAIGKASTASGEWNPQTYTGNISVYNYATSSFENANVTETYNVFDSPVRSQKTLQSYSAGITSYFWEDRITTTLGARLDKFKARNTTTGTIVLDDGTVIPQLTSQQKFDPNGYFISDAIWNRFGKASYLTGRTKTGGGVVRPFRNWDGIERRANSGNQFWQLVRDFGFTYNWSNNFDAPAGAQVDAFGKPLPKPEGVGRDIGIEFTALDNKLFARITWFKATNVNQRLPNALAISRLTSNVDTTLFRGWARTIALINLGLDPTTANFATAVGNSTAPGNGLTTAQEQVVEDAVTAIWKQPYNYYNNLPGTITATGDAEAEGIEAQINYNVGNWRNRFTFGKQETINSNVLTQFDQFAAYRMPTFLAAKAADYLLPQYQNLKTYTKTDTTPVDITNFWTAYGFDGSVKLNDQFGNSSVQTYYANNVTPQVQINRDLNGQAAPNQRKYRWAYNTGYDFSRGWIKGFGLGGAERWESKSVIGYYGKSSGSLTNPKLLDISDTTRPIYDKANYYTDIFLKYSRKVWNSKVGMTIQLNVDNVFEDGHLQVTAVNYDGSPWGYRIIDSRLYKMSASFEF